MKRSMRSIAEGWEISEVQGPLTVGQLDWLRKEEGWHLISVEPDHKYILKRKIDLMPRSTTTENLFPYVVGLVTDSTPTDLGYEEYRGYVLINADTWQCEVTLTAAEHARLTLGEQIPSDEYADLRPLHATENDQRDHLCNPGEGG